MTQPALFDGAKRFVDERSVAICPTTLASDYTQFLKWVQRCPVQDLSAGREAITWILRQEPKKSARRVAGFLKAFYRWAASEDIALVPVNPVASFKFPKPVQEEDEVVVIPQNEMPFVMAALERRAGQRVRWDLAAQVMYQTGVRTGEMFAIRAEDIQGERLLIHQNLTLTHGLKHSTKTNKRRWVPLNEMVRGILEELTPVDGFLFPWPRRTFQTFFRSRMQELHGLGLISRRYRPYDLRHTAISRWLEAGVPVAQCALWAGNSAEVIWKHYAGATDDYPIPVL